MKTLKATRLVGWPDVLARLNGWALCSVTQIATSATSITYMCNSCNSWTNIGHFELTSFKNNRGLTWDTEIKASDIRSGRGGFVGWDGVRRQFFLENLMELVGGNPDITLLGVVIDKQRVDTARSDRLVKPEVRSLELLLERYNLFLRDQRDKSGIVILDPTKEKSDDNLRRFQSFLLAHSEHLDPLHIVEGAFFAKSHTSNLIQIADVCTNVFYREVTRGTKAKEYKAMQERFWRRGGRLTGVGIKKWP